jgi:MauM/NapG family ferredoxin protein
LAGAVFSLPVISLFDPMIILSQAIHLELIGILPVVLFFSLNLFGKRFYCYRLCPLGSLWDLASKVKIPIRNKSFNLNLDRRRFFASIGVGLIAGSLLRLKHKPPLDVLRPPNSLEEDDFISTCIRCGRCVEVCPTRGLESVLLDRGIIEIFTPRFLPKKGPCIKECNLCSLVCPTDAIADFSLQEKTKIKIGIASVNRERCITWKKTGFCFMCIDQCPYKACKEKKVPHAKYGVPVVDSEKCTGCGLCEHICPIAGAITVRSRKRS